MDTPSASAAPAEASAATTPPMVEIELEVPIKRGTMTIDKVHLRKPGAGEMRGLQMQPLIQGDFNSVMTLLTRITVPQLTMPEIEALDTIDIGAMGGAIYGFFMSRREREAMAKVMGAIDTELQTG